MYKNLKLLNYLIYLLLLFYLFVDMLTGISLQKGGMSLSIPYKIMIIGLMLIVIGMYNQNDFLIILTILLWLCLSVVLLVLFGGENLTLSIQTYIKIFSVVIFYFYFKSYPFFETNYNKYLKRILVVNTIVFSINIFAGILGFGYSTYSYGVGIKGFFYAGNEIFLVLLTLTTLMIRNQNKKIRFVVGCVSVIFSVLIGTKTGILAILIILFVFSFSKMKKTSKIVFILLFPLLLFSFVLLFSYVLLKIPIFNTIMYNFNKNKDLTGSIVEALLSGRIEFLRNNLNLLKKEGDFLHLFFGGNAYYEEKNVEIDFFDTLILNGVVTSISILFFYLLLLYKACKKKDITLIALNFTCILISFTAGHVWANLTGGIFFIIVNLFPYVFCETRKKRKKHCFFI